MNRYAITVPMVVHAVDLIVVARGEILWYWSHLVIITNFEYNRHADLRMEIDVAMEQPETRIVGNKTYDGVSAVGNGNSVFYRCSMQSPLHQASIVEALNLHDYIYCVFKLDMWWTFRLFTSSSVMPLGLMRSMPTTRKSCPCKWNGWFASYL